MTAYQSVAICDACWRVESPQRNPTRVDVGDVEVEPCYRCGSPTASGIYVRRPVPEVEVEAPPRNGTRWRACLDPYCPEPGVHQHAVEGEA